MFADKEKQEADVNAAENAEVILKTQKGDLKLTGKSTSLSMPSLSISSHLLPPYSLLSLHSILVILY